MIWSGTRLPLSNSSVSCRTGEGRARLTLVVVLDLFVGKQVSIIFSAFGPARSISIFGRILQVPPSERACSLTVTAGFSQTQSFRGLPSFLALQVSFLAILHLVIFKVFSDWGFIGLFELVGLVSG